MSALFLPDRSNIDIEDIIFNELAAAQVSQFLKEYQFREILERYELPVANKLLFFGKTGCGKTMTAKAIANYLNKKIITVNLSGIISSKLGETSKNIELLFKEAKQQEAVLFFDEFDSLGQIRDFDNNDSSEMKRVVNSLLQLIDHFPKNAILIAATNQINRIDEALIRRFELKVEFTAPDDIILNNYYDRLLSKYPSEFCKVDRIYGISFAEAKDHIFKQVKHNIITAELNKNL